jgi:hypothetical protein
MGSPRSESLRSPLSASLRSRNLRRYLVRSYVTAATTIRAMTEMPVKTPMPIGRTANFLPGIEESEAPATPAAEGETDVFDVEGDEIELVLVAGGGGGVELVVVEGGLVVVELVVVEGGLGGGVVELVVVEGGLVDVGGMVELVAVVVVVVVEGLVGEGGGMIELVLVEGLG